MKIAIIQFPGSNCERETALAVKRTGMEPVEFLWNQPKENLAEFDGFIIVGGFSYEDRSRAGAIAALDPLMSALKNQSELGKPILGICNGAQILVESGLVPGVENNKLSLVLTDNKRIQAGKVLGTGYYNAWVHMRVSDNYQYNAFTRQLTPKQILRVPVAHAEGRFVIPTALLEEMRENGLHVFQYCNEHGSILNEFPVNPNGSVANIAAISNKAGNVMAMMPHPERTFEGDAIFQSMKVYISEKRFSKVAPLNYYPRPYEIKKYQPQYKQLLIGLIITDNHAVSVQNALRNLNIPVKVNRVMHWEINCPSEDEWEKIKKSGLLYNDRKERVLQSHEVKLQGSKTFLVRAKEDIVGQQKLQLLQDHFDVKNTTSISHSILWQLEGSEDAINQVINSHILFNGYAHDCYDY